LGTTWPVVTEAMCLLGFAADAQDELWGLLESGRLHLFGLDAADAPRMRALMRKYRDLPMDLADASLVAVAEREGISKVFTLDRRDFGVYRLARGGRFSVIP
jgi:predicted nucleic acid-binding protein